MAREHGFRILLPIAQSWLAIGFGGFGLWRRSAILSRPLFDGQTLWDSTARFHVWPWPYKFASVLNLPALIAGSLVSLPLDIIRPNLPEYVANVPVLLFIPLLWYWIGSRLDKRWRMADKAPWIALSFHHGLSRRAFLPLGYTGFLPYGFVVWAITIVTVSRHLHACGGIPVNKNRSFN